MKKRTLSKNIRGIKSSASYDVKSIVNEIKKYYNDNNFSNEILLERLQQLRVEKLYMDSLQGAIVGLLIGVLAMDSNIANTAIDLTKDSFSTNIFIGLVVLIALLIIILIVAGIVLATINFIKFMYYKMVKSDVVENFLDEKEIEIIMQILNDRINE